MPVFTPSLGGQLFWGTWLCARNSWFTAAAGLTSAVLIFLFIRIHDAVHYPGASSLERLRWFWFLDRHDYIHHVDNSANTNFLLPLGDLLMGTLRRELTPLELKRWPADDSMFLETQNGISTSARWYPDYVLMPRHGHLRSRNGLPLAKSDE